jgi:hypothetical protein
MPDSDQPDPVRVTLVAVLQQLNRAESMHEGTADKQALELPMLERLLADLASVRHDEVKVPVVLGLLLRNGLVRAELPPRSAGTKSRPRPRYRITAQGKQFLIEAVHSGDRIA